MFGNKKGDPLISLKKSSERYGNSEDYPGTAVPPRKKLFFNFDSLL
jgi:hypothetical protein